MEKAEIYNFSTSLPLDISQVSAVMIFHILQVMYRREIVKIVNLGKEVKNDKKCNEKKFMPCMDLPHPKQ